MVGRIRSLKELAGAEPSPEIPIRRGRQQREQGLLVSCPRADTVPAEPAATNHLAFGAESPQRFPLTHFHPRQGGQADTRCCSPGIPQPCLQRPFPMRFEVASILFAIPNPGRAQHPPDTSAVPC